MDRDRGSVTDIPTPPPTPIREDDDERSLVMVAAPCPRRGEYSKAPRCAIAMSFPFSLPFSFSFSFSFAFALLRHSRCAFGIPGADMNRMNTRHTRGNAKDGSVQDFWSSSITGSKTNGSKRPLCESTCLSKPYTFVPVAGVVRRAQFHKVGVESRFSSTVYFYMCWSSSCSIVFITPATRHTLWGNLCASVEDKSIARHTTLPRQSGNSKDGCRASTSTYHTPFSWRKAEGRKHDSLDWNPPLTLTSIFLFRPAPLPLFPRFRTIPFLT